jgi:cell division GTPase FtsZ
MSEENNDDQIKAIYGEADISMPDLMMPEASEDVEQLENEMKVIEDRFKGSFDFCFIGAGQGGCRVAQAFHRLGYGRVAAVNTAEQDLNTLNIENKLCIGDGGAGKEPDLAKKAIEERKEDVLDFMRYSFGQKFDRIFVCAGAGGGSGSGMVVPLVNIAKEVQELHKTTDKQVGVILTLPKKSEGKKVSINAYNVVKQVYSLVRQNIVSPLIILDNEKVAQMYPNVAVSKFFDVANSSLTGLFHLFNLTSAKDSSYSSFDKNDYRGILNSGMMLFGASPVKNFKDPVEISRVVRSNLKGNLLCGSVDVTTGNTAGVIVVGGPEILDSLPQSFIDEALDQINRMLQAGSVVHGGVYSGDKPNLNIFSAVGGLAEPSKRMEELLKDSV